MTKIVTRTTIRAKDDANEAFSGLNHDNLDDFLANGHVKPVHPGIIYRVWVIERQGQKVTNIADKSGISREMLHRILRGEASITPKTAIGLGEASDTEAEFWLRAQNIFDLWTEREKRRNAALKPA